MSAIIGWSVAAVLGLIVAILQWSWRKHATDSLAKSEFIAIVFLDPVVYQNNRRVFVDAIDDLPTDVAILHAFAASKVAHNIATSYIGQLGINSVVTQRRSDAQQLTPLAYSCEPNLFGLIYKPSVSDPLWAELRMGKAA